MLSELLSHTEQLAFQGKQMFWFNWREGSSFVETLLAVSTTVDEM